MSANPNFLSVLVGGIIPAFLFGVSGFLQKGSSRVGIGVGHYLICAGLTAAVSGVVWLYAVPGRSLSLKAGCYACVAGAFWAAGTSLVVFAILRYSAPLSKLAPLYNMNTLVTVLLALLVFTEWSQVSVCKLILGALLIIAGGTLVAQA